MIIVSDASPLIGLSRINQIDILCNLFSDVIIPKVVADEFTALANKPGASAIIKAIKNKKLTVYTKAFDTVQHISKVLGAGEVEAISLAVKLQVPLLIDEIKGRVAAKQHNVDVIGTGGILIAAKKQKILTAVKPVLEDLTSIGYRLSENLIKEILKRANER